MKRPFEYDVPADNGNIRFGVKAHHIAHLPCVEGAEKSFCDFVDRLARASDSSVPGERVLRDV